jgi:superfamily II DNA or RNA helicase
MCFTATIDDPDNYAFITSMAPMLHKTDINRARELQLVAPYYVFNLEIQMCEKSKAKYAEILHMYNYYESLLGGPMRAFANAGYIIKQVNDVPKADRTQSQKDLLTKAVNYWRYMQKRKSFLYNCDDKIDVTKQILQKFSDRKALVFSETIDFAKKINNEFPNESVMFHSSMSARARKDALLAFQSDLVKTRIISAVKALNAGFNVPSCSLGICASGNSKWLDFIQRQGRVIRKTDNKTAIFVNLYIAETQEAKWVSKRTKIINPNYLKWIKTIQEITI